MWLTALTRYVAECEMSQRCGLHFHKMACTLIHTLCCALPMYAAEPLVPAKEAGVIRVATFNVSLNRKRAGELADDLRSGFSAANESSGSRSQFAALAAIIRAVQPDVLLLNEVDYAPEAENARPILRNFLGQAGAR